MKRGPSPITLVVSLALHIAALYAASRVSWRAVDVEEREQHPVVWLRENALAVPVPERRPSPELTEPEAPEHSAEDVERRELEETEAPQEPSAVPQTSSDETPIIDEASVDDVERESDELTVSEDRAADDALPRRRAPARAEVDWEKERRQAVQRADEQHEREESYITFSFDDLVESGTSEKPEEPGASSKSVFDSATAWREGMIFGDSTGATIEWVSDRCYKKSGGIGNIFAFPESVAAANLPMTACVRLISRRDLFEYAKPEYLKVRPAGHSAAPAQ